MREPLRIQLSRRKGWRMPPNTVKVDRTTRWGNPFRVGRYSEACDGTAEHCVLLFRAMLSGWICSTSNAPLDAQRAYPVRDIARELRGKNLACWCPIGAPCHADVLLEIANADEARP